MNPKVLQYFMGQSYTNVTMNAYTNIAFDDVEEDLKWMERLGKHGQRLKRKMMQKRFVEDVQVCV